MKLFLYLVTVPGRLLGSVVCASLFSVCWFFYGLGLGLVFPWLKAELQHSLLKRLNRKQEEA